MLDMFGAVDTNTVQTAFVDTKLSVILTSQLDNVQIKAFIAGAIRISGIKSCQIDTFAPHSEENTAFILTFIPGIPGSTLIALDHTAKAYAESFLQDMKPTAKQPSLF